MIGRCIHLTVLLVAVSSVAWAQRPYKEVDAVFAATNDLKGRSILVHGTVDRIAKDGLSATSFLVILEGGLKCRVSRDAFLRSSSEVATHAVGGGRVRDNTDSRGKVLFNSARMGDLRIERDGTLMLSRGTDIILRGTLKKESTRWTLDRAIIVGCRDATVRSLLGITCEGPCTCSEYYKMCSVCQGSWR